jgi:hypothetical protein
LTLFTACSPIRLSDLFADHQEHIACAISESFGFYTAFYGW